MKNVGDEGLQRLQSIGVCDEHQHRERKGVKILLELEVLVGRDQHVEVDRRELKQHAVLEAGPASLANRPNRVADEESAEWRGSDSSSRTRMGPE